MYRLVADVEGYPSFLPWCSSAAVHERSERHLVASLEVAKGPVHKRFTTRNVLDPEQGMEIRLVEGPFRYLEGQWRFLPLGDEGCKVELDLNFELSSGILQKILTPVFAEIANSMVDAFCKQARVLHG